MIKIHFLTVILLSITVHLFSQRRTEDFAILLPDHKVEHSLYSKIAFVDSRFDTTNMGIVQLGAFNKKAKVVAQSPLALQLSRVLTTLTDTTANNGELLFQLRQFNFAEITSAGGERGYCYLRAALYAKNNNEYHELGFIDTVILIRSLDVTRALFRSGSKLITNFIASNLTHEAYGNAVYSYNDVVNIDSIEKRNIIVYNTTNYVDGFYENYQSFMDMVPDGLINVDMRNDRIFAVKTTNSNGKPQKLRTGDIYAIVYNGKPFIATEYGYYPLHKTEDDFYFTGRAKVTAKAGDVIMASLFFGIIGGLVASEAEATFKMKLDHLNGGFIRLEEVTYSGR